MVANFRRLGCIVAALALICLLGFEFSAASAAQETTTATALLVVTAERDHAHRGVGNEHHDKEGAKSSCCTSAACSSAGVMSTLASLFVKPTSLAYRVMPIDRLIPFEQSPSERPPRAA
jgi:hypothetical protein